ncbi:MAG: hypothetical protein GY845_13765 [Planctomycetes bacterium]|nr:hypothetical protein [Planctomycetota bacterium]
MSAIKTLGDLIRKLTEEGIDLDDVGINYGDLYYKMYEEEEEDEVED